MNSAIPLMLLVCAALIRPAQAQVREAWVARHSLSPIATNQAAAIAVDKDSNVIVGGHGTSTNGDFDYVVLKYSPVGSLMWEAKYGSMSNDLMRGMVVDGDRGVVLTGTGGTAKWSVDGTQRWSTEHGGRALAVDSSADVYLTGHRETSFSTMKLHRAAGTNLWERTRVMIPGKRDLAQVISVDGNSNVYVGGEIVCYWEPRSAYSGHCIVSYDSDGAVRWQTPVPMSECIYSSVKMIGIGLDKTGALYEVAEAGGVETVKYDEAGLSQWTSENTYAFGGLKAASFDENGFIYLTGVAIDFDQIAVQFRTIKISPFGTNVWSAGYGQGIETKIANAIALDSAGNVYVTGQSAGIGTGNDYTTIKYSPSGQELWVQRYDGPAHGDDVATAIAVAPDGSVYVTGWSTSSSNLVEITTIKYTQPGSASLTVETNRTVSLEFPGTPGATNRVQATTDFLDWLELGFSVTDTNGLIHFLDTNAPNYPIRFYRTVTP